MDGRDRQRPGKDRAHGGFRNVTIMLWRGTTVLQIVKASSRSVCHHE
ncbi:hypothetical protein GJA_4549 [Janthinobacterium agaricidamnosum NBRC 102515 = DSM 9628]|uniref:Uncharacterized protein n=1 Tax=Janthinobacterium agaricidamnosum NBRC 102515 = DSM 9628 TaxID=1349767 RepID=W0VBA1_9BURK|nr:hypothetical protein GJA_4549 [Janthinobacterium agaricidamnosum NBRC 102515 = DSM 9628]